MATQKNSGKKTSGQKKKSGEQSHNGWLVVLVILTLIAVIVLLVPTLKKKRENAALLKQQEAYMESVAEAQSWAEELQELRDRELTEEQIIEIAREKFGLVFPDEIQFVPEK